jgi:hypothetical protein
MFRDGGTSRRGLMALLVLGSTLVGLGLAESILRWCLPIYGVVLGPHPRYLHTLLAGTRTLMIDDSRPGLHFYMVRINSDGHWGPEESPNKPGYRIVVYGDSFIDSRYAPREASFAARLERRLSDISGSVVVVNAGVSGYGPDQESLRLEDDLSRRHPDLVVVALYAGNDFGDLIRNKLFWPGPDGSAQEADHVVGPDALGPFREAPPLHLQRALIATGRKVRWLRARVASGSLTGAQGSSEEVLRILGDRRREYESYVQERDPVIRNLLTDGYDLDVSLHPSGPESEFKRALMAAVLRRIHETAVRFKVPLVFLVIPSPVDVSQGWPLTVDRTTFPEYQPSGATDFLASEALRLGVPCVNLFDSFREAGGRPLFREQVDRHWNPAGMDLAARLTAEAIRSHGFLDPVAAPGTRPADQAF